MVQMYTLKSVTDKLGSFLVVKDSHLHSENLVPEFAKRGTVQIRKIKMLILTDTGDKMVPCASFPTGKNLIS